MVVGPLGTTVLGGLGCEALQGKKLAFPGPPEVKFGLGWRKARQKVAQSRRLGLRPLAQPHHFVGSPIVTDQGLDPPQCPTKKQDLNHEKGRWHHPTSALPGLQDLAVYTGRG